MYTEEMLRKVIDVLNEAKKLMKRRFGARVLKHIPDYYDTSSKAQIRWLKGYL